MGTHLADRIPSYPLCRRRRFLTEILRRAQPLIGPSGFAGEQTKPGAKTGTLEQPLSLVTQRVECSLGCLGFGWRSERSQRVVRRVDFPRDAFATVRNSENTGDETHMRRVIT